jgi:DNA-binding HxlR family transcriptional regulator
MFARATCPVARALDAIGDWWSILIIRDAFDGIRRFSNFQRNLGIAKGMLTIRLRKLVEVGILELAPASDGSAYSEYVLTKRGRALFHVVVSLRQWGDEHLFAPGEVRSKLIDSQRRRPVRKLELRAQSGQLLKWSDTVVENAQVRKERRAAGNGVKRNARGRQAFATN